MAMFYNRSWIVDIKQQILIFYMLIDLKRINFPKANYKRQQGALMAYTFHPSHRRRVAAGIGIGVVFGSSSNNLCGKVTTWQV